LEERAMQAQESSAPEIDIKEAVQRAKDFAGTLFDPENIEALGLEAVERSDDRRFWQVTLGFTRPNLQRRGRGGSLIVRHESQIGREYKVFRVNARSGEVVAVTIFKE
jgi:hypothetical protein